MCNDCSLIAKSTVQSTKVRSTTRTIEELSARYEILMARSGKLANRAQQGKRTICESQLQAEHDSISDDMIALCHELSRISAESLKALKVKASLMLDVMSDDDDPTVFLAVSICDDILQMVDA